jgi:hypothetical protein
MYIMEPTDGPERPYKIDSFDDKSSYINRFHDNANKPSQNCGCVNHSAPSISASVSATTSVAL